MVSGSEMVSGIGSGIGSGTESGIGSGTGLGMEGSIRTAYEAFFLT